MHTQTASYTIADLCRMLANDDLIVNKEYQRSEGVWPTTAQAFLIDTILGNYPIPKLIFFQATDVATRRTISEVVDGQQRLVAIRKFYNDELVLSKKAATPTARGRRFSSLPLDLQGIFLSYALSADLLLSATPADVRETFRRINSYTVPLNPEEQRHAIYQGDFKWFAYNLARALSESLSLFGVFGTKEFIRMADIKLLCELIDAILNGIRTTDKAKLDALYSAHDDTFPQAAELENRLTRAVGLTVKMDSLFSGTFARAHMYYSLVLAISHLEKPVPALQAAYAVKRGIKLDAPKAAEALGQLSDIVELGEDAPDRWKAFVEASTEKTNVANERKRRFATICRVLDKTAAE